jgi:hypothetical protein
LKSLVTSKMFDDINCDFKYSRDLQELKVKLQTDYKKKGYSFNLESSEMSQKESLFSSEIKWVEHVYSLKANSSLKDNGRVQVEIHLDRIRDVHLEIWGTAKYWNNFGMECKWDANRDPSQKILLSYEFEKPKVNIYRGNVLISYPDRTMNVKIDFSNEGPYIGKVKLSWSADESIEIEYSIGGSLSIGSEFQNHKKLWAFAKIDTPFVGWRNNKINGSFTQLDNLLSFNLLTQFAENQNISTQFFINYLLANDEFFCELKSGIQSTIKDLPIVTAYFKHNQTSEAIISELLFKHRHFFSEEFRIFSIKSVFKHLSDVRHKNISGSIKFKSPFPGYNSGAIITKFSLTKERELFGVFDMDIDSRLYTFALEGYLRKLFDNMLSFNLTTPISGFPYLSGNIGIIELKRYLIADLKTLNRSIGIEILFNFNSITDFDLKLYVATPQPAFEKVLAIGRIQDETIHLEGHWNKLKLGFKGIWRFLNYNNFEYSYMLFTPLVHFEENGLIVKFVAKTFQMFDIESSLRLGKYKIGLKAFGEPRTQLINQLGLQKASYIRDDFVTNDELDDKDINDESTEVEGSEFNSLNYFSVIGNFEFCTMFINPIVGNYEVQQKDDTYHGDAKIHLPINTYFASGIISIRDKLVIKENYNFKNVLTLCTPFEKFEEIISNIVLKVPPSGFTARFDISGLQGLKTKRGFKLSYIIPENQQYTIHDIKLVILYPLKETSRITISTKVELENSSLHSAVFNLDGFNTILSMSGNSNVSNNYI